MSRRQRVKLKKGQSTLEYIVIVAVVMGAIVTLSLTAFRTSYQSQINRITDQMVNVLNRVQF